MQKKELAVLDKVQSTQDHIMKIYNLVEKSNLPDSKKRELTCPINDALLDLGDVYDIYNKNQIVN